ncbi:uncharacterized protein DUF4920 [Roseivirga ehrenbergii]|uniref:DUF4920 domain-containing protein n=1 Tax=Roseivirga ehrenbergii (strain DSM 102268 / JCM 13514 / KCTC 12282 / NCIMB 14502 / KMM 6017) TaxID=279360 RepID=A0A150XIY2_ROSEK|nr:DUF4920 domain-containing protein [Roseivirga ehrenbergii]KYG78674.1 hypothetical protein MB14_18270 [Roseivirga ehrenbergii]TCL10349.1 uncharacterized protein DUF4920 [Roseivirga ehrenbergii]
MKKISTLLLIALFVFSCAGKKEEVKWDESTVVGYYGEKINNENIISVEDMMNQLNESDSIMVKVEGEITATCAMKGCWMNLVLPSGEEMRVTFKDYAFFVPKEGMEGNRAIIEGKVKRSMTDVATLKHYAEDAGKSVEEIAAITEDKNELAFEATGVIILNSEEKSL